MQAYKLLLWSSINLWCKIQTNTHIYMDDCNDVSDINFGQSLFLKIRLQSEDVQEFIYTIKIKFNSCEAQES
jgi:hypothetical protein